MGWSPIRPAPPPTSWCHNDRAAPSRRHPRGATHGHPGVGRLLRNVTRDHCLAERAILARGLLGRARGLLGRRALLPGEALILVPCAAIHTAGLGYPIDALFVDRSGRCLGVASWLRPWRIGPRVAGTAAVIELPAGGAGPTRPGDRIRWDI